MTLNEFLRQCIDLGYANKKDRQRIKRWCEENQKDLYSEDDFMDVFRYLNMPKH